MKAKTCTKHLETLQFCNYYPLIHNAQELHRTLLAEDITISARWRVFAVRQDASRWASSCPVRRGPFSPRLTTKSQNRENSAQSWEAAGCWRRTV